MQVPSSCTEVQSLSKCIYVTFHHWDVITVVVVGCMEFSACVGRANSLMVYESVDDL